MIQTNTKAKAKIKTNMMAKTKAKQNKDEEICRSNRENMIKARVVSLSCTQIYSRIEEISKTKVQ